ncbi:hypothetical protein JCM11251_000270 [Rhodosporidiobolus azoricus]
MSSHRSPSPTHSSHSAKRRRYDDELSPRHRDSHSSRRSHRDDDRDYDRSHRSERRGSSRERSGRRDRDRDYDSRDHDSSRRVKDRDHERDRDYERRRDRDYERDRDYDRDHRRRRDDDYYSSSSSRRDRHSDRRDDRNRGDDRRRSSRYEDSPAHSNGRSPRSPDSRSERTRDRDERPRSPVVPSSSAAAKGAVSREAPSATAGAAGLNGHSTPLPASAGSASPLPTGGTPSAEEEKQRLKREKLEAWKKKKAAEAAAAASASPSPAPGSPAPKAASPAPPSSLPAKPVALGLPAKPTGGFSSLPSKPITATSTSSSSSTTISKPTFKPAATPASAADAASAAAAAISARLSGLSAAKANPLAHSLPAKPTFSLGTGALTRPAGAGSGLKNSLTMGADEDEDGEGKKPGMIKFDDEVDLNVKAPGDGDVDMDDEDDEDLDGGGGAFKGRDNAAIRAAARMRAIEAEMAGEGGDGEAEEEKMQVDEEEEEVGEEKKQEEAEDEEEDELDAFMSTVNAQVKKVDTADQAKAKGKNNRVGMKMEDEEEEEKEDGDLELDEMEKVGMSAQEILALAAKKVKKGRELAVPDHSKIEYLPFRKAFYSAPPEVAELSQEEVDALRLELDDIKIRGAEPPKPATKWSYFGLPAACIDVIKSLEYAAPTSIQAQAIPSIMSGRDIIGVAKTGSGKTMAFILPMFRHIKDQPPLRPMDGPVAMIMTPTRELATQIYKECKPFLKALGLRASCAYGGMPLKDNIADMKRGSEVIVCTPGRMIELLTTNSGRLINLQRVTYLVLDEADRMFDMGFEPQVMKIIGQIRPDRQTVLFSATFPRQMEALARKVLRRPLEITVGGRSVVADTITQVVEVRPEETKFNRMLELLGKLFNEEEDARALIFVERQESADKLFVELKNKNYTCMPLHGGREQVDRDQTIVDFKNGSCPIVIATSVAARGLDVKQLKLVIQYDVPNHMEDYVHRAGRTGRAGNTGTCVTFITPEQERYSVDILKALQASKAAVPTELEDMAKAFAEKVKAGKAQAASSGFGGKGLERLDNDRESAMRAERAAHGEAAGEKKDGAEGEESEADKTAKSVANLEIEIMRGPAPDLAKGKMIPTDGGVTVSAADSKAADEAAKKAEEAAIAAGKNAGAAGAASVIAKFNAMLKAKKASNNQPEDQSTEAARRRDPDATDYHAVVWINDYPQKARWKATNKESMVHYADTTGASITFKGVHYEAGKEPGPNDLPKLHLLIESNEELRVKHAIAEIKKALIEGSTMALEAEQRQPLGAGGAAMGRYSVV